MDREPTLAADGPSDRDRNPRHADENTLVRRGPHAPVLLVQGGADHIVDPQVTQRFVEQLCARGEAVALRIYPGVGPSTRDTMRRPMSSPGRRSLFRRAADDDLRVVVSLRGTDLPLYRGE